MPTHTIDSLKEIKDATLVAKPKVGRSSEDFLIIDDREKIDLLIDDKDKYIFQPLLKGLVVTVDIIRDSFGNFFFIPREELLRTKNGAGMYDFVHNHLKAFSGERIDPGIDYASKVMCKRYVEFV